MLARRSGDMHLRNASTECAAPRTSLTATHHTMMNTYPRLRMWSFSGPSTLEPIALAAAALAVALTAVTLAQPAAALALAAAGTAAQPAAALAALTTAYAFTTFEASGCVREARSLLRGCRAQGPGRAARGAVLLRRQAICSLGIPSEWLLCVGRVRCGLAVRRRQDLRRGRGHLPSRRRQALHHRRAQGRLHGRFGVRLRCAPGLGHDHLSIRYHAPVDQQHEGAHTSFVFRVRRVTPSDNPPQ